MSPGRLLWRGFDRGRIGGHAHLQAKQLGEAIVGQDFVLGRPLLRERQPLAGVGDEVLFSDLAEREE